MNEPETQQEIPQEPPQTQPSTPSSAQTPYHRASRFFDTAPRLIALLTFAAGAIALISAAIPDMRPTKLPIFMTGLSGITLTFGGLALMTLSLGLIRKLKSAWAFTLLAALHGALVTLIFKPRLFEAVMYIALAGLLVIARKSFYRRSSLSNLRFTRLWLFATLLAVAIAGFFALLWVSHQSGFVEASFLDLIIDPDLGRAGRPIAFALLTLALGAFFIAFAVPGRTRLLPPDNSDIQVLSTLFASADAPRPDNVLAFSGDKTVFYGPGQKAAIAYAKAGKMHIAMGAPIGPKADWKPALDAFRAEADMNAATAAIYAAPPDLLPDLIDLGFHVEKIGENAVLDLPDFSLSGRKREVIRRGSRKIAKRAGGAFEIALPPHSPELLERLKPISDAWLTANGSSEKAFSLGKFDPDFLNHCPIGIATLDGMTVAFGSLFVTPDKSWSGIDLMRYDPEKAVTNTMDFLLVELILWAKEEDYQSFDLAMAPLSGLVDADYAPLFARIGRFIFERGERFYNFKGLRRFKQKFNPRWEPRYIAAPNYWSLPIALAHAARLTNKAKPDTKTSPKTNTKNQRQKSA